MAENKFTQDENLGGVVNSIKGINWFGVGYWAAAVVQVVGSFSVFGTVGGSILHAVAGALCLELMILALNSYGVKQSGSWMWLVCVTSLMLIGASAMFQVADLLSHEADAALAAKFGATLYATLRVTIPIVPSVAMGVITLIKFVDAKRNQGVPLAEQLEATERELRQTKDDLASAVHQNGQLLATNAQLAAQPEPQPVATEPNRAVVVVAQPKRATTKGKIDPAQLAAGLERGMSAKELAQLFGVSEAGIRKNAAWKSREVQS